jgi:hypothetical protein
MFHLFCFEFLAYFLPSLTDTLAEVVEEPLIQIKETLNKMNSTRFIDPSDCSWAKFAAYYPVTGVRLRDKTLTQGSDLNGCFLLAAVPDHD